MSEELFRRMLVPVDGSAASLKAARYAARLAARQGCVMTILHVVDEESATEFSRFADRPLEQVLEQMRRSGQTLVDEAQKIGEEEGVQVEGRIRLGAPHREILSQAREEGADLIVMGKVGRRGPRRVLLGSVTERVIEHSAVPVLVVK